MAKETFVGEHHINPFGEIEVAPEVLEVISGIAANEVDGVYAMQGKFTSEVKSMFGRTSHNKGVHLVSDEEGLKVEVYCYFKYGVNVPKVALDIQQRIREQVYHMTEIELTEINIHIVGIVPEKTNLQELFELESEEDETE
ncbi:Asp23/Gls24 family envelope stress response protein [Marinilactibacillus sp. XAAS-LB27]|uniref:Asp23/Gls24 family envelope stress response protein n=1 Tax=Marinilactibacillus sp. XAAS-LB27 TaxID=3114538 RepID=UPI002E198AF0|nr:Asp23/Gls24 family envelope stress response protein [Marinilactibacillus sp. XAAS-LB27]